MTGLITKTNWIDIYKVYGIKVLIACLLAKNNTTFLNVLHNLHKI